MTQVQPSAGETPWHFYGQPTAFVGRVKELHRLREAVRNAIDDAHRRSMLLLGDAGLGKSRLLSEFIDSLDQHVENVTPLVAACRRDAGPPYAVFGELLMQRFYATSDEPPEDARAKVQAGIAQVLGDEAAGEEAAHFIGHLVGLRYPKSKHILSVDADPRRIEEKAVTAFVRLLVRDASRNPLVIWIDDLHLASDESLGLLLKLSKGVHQAPILFLASARPTFGERQQTFVQDLGRVDGVIDLPALADRDCTRIVCGLLERADGVPEAFVRTAVEKALGNPLQLEQIIELHIERGAIEVGGERWTVHPEKLDDTRIPGSLRDVVRSKLARLSPLERRVLEKAAVIGDVFWSGTVDMLRRVDESQQWDDADRFWTTERRSEELLRTFEALRRRHIILRAPQSAFPRSVQYTFKHTLEREVLFDGVEGPRRARYHRLIAQWLEGQEPARREAVVEQVALHWERGHNPRKAAVYYLAAADRAFDRHVNQEAVGLYKKALQCLSDDDAQERLRIFHQLARVHLVIGDHAEALAHCQEMLRLAWLLDDVESGGTAYNKMGQAYRALGEFALALDHFKNGLALFRRVEDILGVAASADDIGRVHRLRGNLDLAEERVREGLRLRRYLNDDRAVAVSLYHLGNVFTERGDFKEAVAAMREALDMARGADDHKTVADILNSIGVICAQRGEYERATQLWGEALGIARMLGERRQEGVLLNNRGEVTLLLGMAEEARDDLEAAVAILQDVGDRFSLSDALRNLAAVHLRLDAYSKAKDYAERALAEARDVGARGQAGLAERALGEVLSRTLFDITPDRDARIATALGHFEASIRDLEAVGLEAELGKTMLAHGAFLAELLREDEARAELGRARALFERLDMKDALDRANRILEAF